jgi:hypothetical protein
MNSCRKNRSLFTDVLYSELTSAQTDEFNNHLKTCSKCAEEFAEIKSTAKQLHNRTRVEPEDCYWEGYWDKLAQRMEKEEKRVTKSTILWQHFKETFSFEPRLTYRFAGAVALLVIGFFFGKLYFGGREDLKFQYNVPEQSTILTAQQVVLKNRTDRYFDRSKVLLLGLINFDTETEDVFTLNLPYRKKISQNLIKEAAILKDEMQDPSYEQINQLISDLEVILLQIANLESELDLDGIEMVKSGVDRKGIMLKINLEAMQTTDERQTLLKPEKTKNII